MADCNCTSTQTLASKTHCVFFKLLPALAHRNILSESLDHLGPQGHVRITHSPLLLKAGGSLKKEEEIMPPACVLGLCHSPFVKSC